MMLQEKLTADLKEVMKAGDKTRLEVIRMVRARIKNTEIAKQKSLDDSDVLDVIAKEAKQRRESIAEFKKADRQDLLDKEEAELAILLEYLPQQISREEILAAARRVIEEVGARGPGDKGKVMQNLIPQLKGKAEGRDINEVVTELLSGSTG
ncbi:MAG: GatB/YqeY domain-containing protein [Dehalococcoidia bacterium]|nr:MAG: GatB/YqeY domain-containing protein [Dehalococcoidia bacterium]